jgi:hypothetical protein
MVQNLKTAQAWILSETFKSTVYESNKLVLTYTYFDMWFDKVKQTSLKAMNKVADMFNRHIKGILNYIKHRITNAKTERFNGKTQNLKNIGRGYRKFKNFRAAILFFNGKLDLYSHKFL